MNTLQRAFILFHKVYNLIYGLKKKNVVKTFLFYFVIILLYFFSDGDHFNNRRHVLGDTVVSGVVSLQFWILFTVLDTGNCWTSRFFLTRTKKRASYNKTIKKIPIKLNVCLYLNSVLEYPATRIFLNPDWNRFGYYYLLNIHKI